MPTTAKSPAITTQFGRETLVFSTDGRCRDLGGHPTQALYDLCKDGRAAWAWLDGQTWREVAPSWVARYRAQGRRVEMVAATYDLHG